MGLRDLKIFNNLSKNTDTGYTTHFTHLAKRRLEAELIEMANKTIKGRVTYMCVEVNPMELPLMLEVLSSSRVQAQLQFQQTEIPTEFLIGLRTLDSFV